MQLKKLEAYGFKSFADKIEVDFDRGITAIVGPNGSGKSNISDAIKWVLGEQNVRNIRGDKAEDIIFAESMGHDVIIHTAKDSFKSPDRLWQLEKTLSTDNFLRISNSVIINTKEIKAIKAALSQKFVVTLNNGSKVDVTRSYYYIFKNKFGI